MTRINIIDTIRGVSFFPMCIFHIFYAYDLVNMFTTSVSQNVFISFLGMIRTIYIVLAGISISLASRENKKDYYTSRLKRSLIILMHAMIITIFTHLLFPTFGIKFGILHFIALGTLLVSPYASSNLMIIISLLLSIIFPIPPINNVIDTISGAMTHYSMADWFPLNRNMPILLIGTLIGGIIYKTKKNNTEMVVKEKRKDTIFEWMGKNSLDLYTGHMIIIISIMFLLKRYNII
jgi:uncharacterized membrane protein